MKDSYVFDSEELFKDNLVQTVEHCIPDIFDEIYNDCINRKDEDIKCKHSEDDSCKKVKDFNSKNITDNDIRNFEDKKNNVNKEILNNLYRGIGTIAAMFAIIISICLYNDISRQKEIKSVVILDVNPSISLSVNKNDKIIKAKGINKDGADVINDINIYKVDIEIALDRIIGAMIDKGFMSEENGTMLITIDNKDVEDGRRLELKTKKNVNKILKASHLKVNVLSQLYLASNDVKDIAKSYKISEGKAKIIKSLTDKSIIDNEGNVISEEELAKYNINEINTILNNNDINIDDILLIDSVKDGTYVDNSQINTGLDIVDDDIKEYIMDNNGEDSDITDNKKEDIKLENVKLEHIKESKKESSLDTNKITSIKVNVKKENNISTSDKKLQDFFNDDNKEKNIVTSGIVNLTNNKDNDVKEDKNYTDNKNNNIMADDTNNEEINESLESINKNESIVGNVQIKNDYINNQKNEHIVEGSSDNKNQYINGSIHFNNKDSIKDVIASNNKLNVKMKKSESIF